MTSPVTDLPPRPSLSLLQTAPRGLRLLLSLRASQIHHVQLRWWRGPGESAMDVSMDVARLGKNMEEYVNMQYV